GHRPAPQPAAAASADGRRRRRSRDQGGAMTARANGDGERGGSGEQRRADADLQDALDRALAGGPERHHDKAREQGKLPVRERVARLLDDGSFAEEALLANWDTPTAWAPTASSPASAASLGARWRSWPTA